MNETIKEKYRNGIIEFDNKIFKNIDYNSIVGETKNVLSEALVANDIEKASSDYEKFKTSTIIPFVEKAFANIKANSSEEIVIGQSSDSIDDDFDLVENNDELEQTKFGMKPVSNETSSNVILNETNNISDTVIDEPDFSDSFILPKDEFDSLCASAKQVEETNKKNDYSDVPMFTPLEQLEEPAQEKDMEPVKTKKKLKLWGKKSKKGDKRAAYVDTVILCLIAQLSIFGLLIIVLLIIK